MTKSDRKRLFAIPGMFLGFMLFSFSLFSCISSAAKAEEYYALGSAYFELKKYAEAENWFSKAKFHKSTNIASIYYLGRIAYETGRYREAESYFEQILKVDGENITALKAAAYTCIKLEELDKASSYYWKVLELVPESYDEGYNYAVVLMALGRAEEAEKVLVSYNNTESPEALLIMARSLRQQGKVEAADYYNTSLIKQDDPVVRSEYAAYLAEMGLSEKALEEYQKALENEKLNDTKKEEILNAIELLEGNGKSSTEAHQ